MQTLIVFAKEPIPGKVKTRLKPLLSGRQCSALYTALLRDTLSAARSAGVGQNILCYESCGRSPVFLRRNRDGFVLRKQSGKDLGDRLRNAFDSVLEEEGDSAVIIGSDTPHLPSDYIKRAFRLLRSYDCVIGPSRDGGYYLIGLKNTYFELFEEIPWSTPGVLAVTMQRARSLGLKISLLPRLEDIDDPDSLHRVMRVLARLKGRTVAVRTREWIRSYGAATDTCFA